MLASNVDFVGDEQRRTEQSVSRKCSKLEGRTGKLCDVCMYAAQTAIGCWLAMKRLQHLVGQNHARCCNSVQASVFWLQSLWLSASSARLAGFVQCFIFSPVHVVNASCAGRCLVVCKSLGIFATAHADGKLYLRALPDIEAEDSPTVTIGDQPIQTLSHSSVAVIQVWFCSQPILHEHVPTISPCCYSQQSPRATDLHVSQPATLASCSTSAFNRVDGHDAACYQSHVLVSN